MNSSFRKVIPALLALFVFSAASCASEKQISIGMIIKEPSAPYIQAFIKAAEETAASLGVNIMIRDGEADSIKIMEIIDTFMILNFRRTLKTENRCHD